MSLRRWTLGVGCSAFVLLSLPVLAAVAPGDVRKELERIEDLRILHRYAVQNLHDSLSLATYLRQWGKPDEAPGVETLLVEAENLFGVVHAVDHGGTGLQAALDASPTNPVLSAAHLDLVQRGRADAARRVNDHYRRTAALKARLTEAVLAAAKEKKTPWDLVSEPLPWGDAGLDAGRQAGLRFARQTDEHFFKMSEAERDYLLGKNRRLGITGADVVWDPVSSWAQIEKAQGRYDFAALDTMMTQLVRHQMKALIGLKTLSGTPPAWLVQQHGSNCQFTVTVKDQKGERKEAQGINLFHGPTADACARFLAAYAAHLKEKWPMAIDGVSLEGVQRELEAVPDESDSMAAYWRAWSKTDTPWRTPESILAATTGVDEAAWVKAEMCREAWLIEYAQKVRAALKAGWNEMAVQAPCLGDDFHRMFASAVGRSRDVFKLSKLSDHPGSSTDSPASFVLLRNAAESRWLWQTGMHTGCGSTPSAATFHGFFHGASRLTTGPMRWGLRAYFPASWFRYCDWQMGDFGIGSYMMAARLSQELSPVFLNTANAPASIGILWSQASMRRDRSRDLWRSTMAFGHMLSRTCFRYDYLPEENLAERLKTCRLLVLSDAQSLSADTCQAIRAWVQDGGILFAFGAPGLYDENGARRVSLPLADVFGADLAQMRVPAPTQPDRLFTGHPEGAFLSPPPLPFMFGTNMAAALQPGEGKARAWYAGGDVAIVEHAFGKGSALWCGYPVGHLYREAAPYEFAYGLSHERTLSYNAEQNQYEAWITAELGKRGIQPEAAVTSGRFLRAQLRDDGDWFHHTVNGPRYREYHLEDERPARTVYAVTRWREGVDNLYVCLLNTEGNYFWDRGYFRSTLGGGTVTLSVQLQALPPASNRPPVAVDARLKAPVPLVNRGDRWEFQAWLPAAQGQAFAIAPTGTVRLFGDAVPASEGPDAILQRTQGYEDGKTLAEVEILEPKKINEFLEARRGKPVVIGCGSAGYQPAADVLAAWLSKRFGITAEVTCAPRRTVIRKAYQDGFGYNQVLAEPASPDILIGHTQDNPFMFRFVLFGGDQYWLPLGLNEDFPGAGRAIVSLSHPVITQGDGNPGGKSGTSQLVIGASFPAEALAAVKKLARR